MCEMKCHKSEVHSIICSTKKQKMIYQPTDQPTIFVKGYLDVRVSSSVILVYGVTIMCTWLHFAHVQSFCTRPPDQTEVWPGDEARESDE